MLRFFISKLRKLHKNNKGMTLTELIVAFALLSLFMVAATRMISYTTSIYYEARGSSYGLEVANVLINKIAGQVEGASTLQGVTENPDEESSESYEMILEKGATDFGDSIRFCDSTGSIVTIKADKDPVTGSDDGYIVIHYDEVKTGTTPYDAVDWRFDSNAYMGYTVTGLVFEQAGSEYPDNVLRMTIALRSPKYGDYETFTYIKCSNLTMEKDKTLKVSVK